MDRALLAGLLGDGLSLAEIGRRVGRHESTVAYWAARYGLVATHSGRHSARGGLAREQLAPLVAAGMSIAEIAARVDRSNATVRYWLLRHGMKTTNGRGQRRSPASRTARDAGLRVVKMQCRHHGIADHVIDGRGYFRCRRCRATAVAVRRRRMKATLVAEAGGRCAMCGYAVSMRALHFHHVDPTLKRLSLNAKGVALSLDTLRAEAAKCVLLCANCHAEVEAGLMEGVPDADAPTMRSDPGLPG
jgi:transposase